MSRRFVRTVLRSTLAASVGALMIGFAPAARAQTATALSIVITPEVPAGATISALPTNTGQRIVIQITNTGTTALTNQQFVVRLAQKPDLIGAVNDGVGNVGLVDAASGAWYHTIAQLPQGATLTYSVSAFKFCPGRWPIAVRVGDKLGVVLATWTGQADARCLPDETVIPAPASYYALAWPPAPTIVPPASTTTTIVPGGVASATTTTVPTVPTAPTFSGPTTSTVVTLGGPKPTLINLTLNASTTTTTTTTITPPTTTSKSGRAPTTTIVFCKTVGGTRYCAPKYSVYKDGQKKAIQLPAKSTKKTKKKTR